MLKSYPLTMQGVEFRGHGVTGIYEMGETTQEPTNLKALPCG
nr:hypothetical protein [uncultured Campylobacter sp.]